MPSSTLLRRPALVLAVGLCGIAAVTSLLGRLTTGPQTQTKPIALDDVEGSIAYPAFSADGNRLAYAQRGPSKEDLFHIYARRLPKGAVNQLTNGDGNEISPAWSPDGARIAFLRVKDGQAQLVAIPSAGGAETKIAEFPAADNGQPLPELAWSHDGATIAAVSGGEKQPAAIVFVSVADGKVRRASNPPAGSDGDWSPAFAPDGTKLAFVRDASSDSGDVYVADANGANPQRLTFNEFTVRGLAWAPNGELIYAAPRMNRFGLWRLAPGGSPREVIGTGDESRYPAVSAAGNRLGYIDTPDETSIWRAAVTGKAETEEISARPVIRSNGRERLASYSSDGKRIADISDQTGFDEIWISDSDGGNRLRVTNFAAAPEHPFLGRPVWAPDGQWLLFDESGPGGSGVWKVRAQAGSTPLRLVGEAGWATWSHDGKSVYYSSRGQIWKASADGSNPLQVTDRGASGMPAESADGKFVYYRRGRASIWRVPSNGGSAETVIEGEGPIIGDPIASGDGIYYLAIQRFGSGAVSVLLYNSDTKQSSEVTTLRLGRNLGFSPSFSISPDGKYILFARVEQARSKLMLVENFK